jgi:hypothetical protein
MNPKLDRRLGKIWGKVRDKLGSDETDKFLDLVIQDKDFDDLPPSFRDLVLKIEGEAKEKAA